MHIRAPRRAPEMLAFSITRLISCSNGNTLTQYHQYPRIRLLFSLGFGRFGFFVSLLVQRSKEKYRRVEYMLCVDVSNRVVIMMFWPEPKTHRHVYSAFDSITALNVCILMHFAEADRQEGKGSRKQTKQIA